MSTHDKSGRPYAKLSKLREGDWIELDSGFTCHEAGPVSLHKMGEVLYFTCNEGCHNLNCQTDDGEHLVGIYRVQS